MADEYDLSETDRGYLLSGMSEGTVAMMLGRSPRWVREERARLSPPLPGIPIPDPGPEQPPLRLTEVRAGLLRIADVLAFAAWVRHAPARPRGRPRTAVRPAPQPRPHRVDRAVLRDLYEAKGLNPFAISKRLAAEGITISDVGVRKALKRLGLLDTTRKGRPRLADDRIDEMVRLYEVEGLSSYEVAGRVGVDPSSVKRWLALRGVAMRPRSVPSPAKLAAGPRVKPSVAPRPQPCDLRPAGSSQRPVGGVDGENVDGAVRTPGGPSLRVVTPREEPAPTIPARTMRWCRQFRAARWRVKDVAWLFDLDEGTLRAALGG